MAKAKLILITGVPASGKSTLAIKLSQDTQITLITKDQIKERLFEILGVKDRAWSSEIGAAAMDLLSLIAQQHIKAGSSVMLEANFHRGKAENHLRKFLDKNVDVIQIVCSVPDEVARARFNERVAVGDRHPGHNDDAQETKDAFENFLEARKGRALDLESEVLEVDTSSEESVKYDDLLKQVNGLLK